MAKQHTSETDKAKVDTDQLIADFKVLVADAEALLHATADQGGEGVEKIRAQAQDSLAQAKANLNDLQEDLSAKAKAMAAGADQFVHQKPWESVGLAAGLGLLIGLLISRR